ncbi:hypothetical protein [Nocardia pseudobrasiliensis]|uniref:Uncharacterized protein n=1 Tax=Nocardia pseudobrasiliensis TaxID=45979 RepID=A0A370HZV1_9NOCA|nr:hypothetical protein [Nocardia pseudobrasiliensis]RDI64043.1 hypothetical protein DFR76_109384 [Nocardia pseudobrasiliensis]
MTTTSAKSKMDMSDWLGLGVLQLFGYVATAIRWAVLFPMISIPIGLAVTGWVLMDWGVGVGAIGVFAAGIMLWRWQRPEMFERWITRRARARFLTWWRYRNRWATRVHACGLTLTWGDSTLVPRLEAVEIGVALDRLRVRMLEGQCPDDYYSRAERIAHTFGASECRTSIVGPGIVALVLRHADSLAAPVSLPRSGGHGRKEAA